MSLSTAEEEYHTRPHDAAIIEGAKEGIWLRTFLEELLHTPLATTLIRSDNEAAIAWSNSDESLRTAKHIDIKVHFVRDCVQAEKVVLQYVSSAHNLADGFTKPLDREKFQIFRNRLGIMSPDNWD